MIRVKDEEEWRAPAKLVRRFKGANVQLDRQHLKAAAGRGPERGPGPA
jgi:hypothetical protein